MRGQRRGDVGDEAERARGGEKKERGRGKEIYRAESMCSEWPQRPLGVATVHFYQLAS